MKSAFYTMVLDEFKHASIIERESERERKRKRDACLVFIGEKHCAIE